MYLGAGGIGKTTAMKHVGLTWADGSSEVLMKFQAVFYIALKDVKAGQSIEDIIVEQHCALYAKKVQPEEIKHSIEECPKQNIVLLFDGYDEYRNGTNSDIDKIITKHYLRNCLVIITSRENKDYHNIREFMDAEAEITGFDKTSVTEYMSKFLGSTEKQTELITIAQNGGIVTKNKINEEDNDLNYGILCIPFLLNMICVLFIRKVSLPRTKTGIISAIVERCLDWEHIRRTGQRGAQDVEKALVRLGELVLKRLQQTLSSVFL